MNENLNKQHASLVSISQPFSSPIQSNAIIKYESETKSARVIEEEKPQMKVTSS